MPIQNERVRFLNDKPENVKGKTVIYWMQQAQRTNQNHALEYAIAKANTLKKPLIVYFGLTAKYPSANARHYRFMLEGLNDVKAALTKRGIKFVVEKQEPQKGIVKIAENACLVVADMGYLAHQRQWRKEAAKNCGCAFYMVESDVIVPVEAASDKQEYAAKTIRKKIMTQLDKYLVPVKEEKVRVNSLKMKTGIKAYDIEDVDRTNRDLGLNKEGMPRVSLRGGQKAAMVLLEEFVERKLAAYETKRNDPNEDSTSNLSAYLHFGQISSLQIAIAVLKRHGWTKASEDFLEELIVRRELSANFVYYNENYMTYECLPDWAKKTLEKHAKDSRPYLYDLKRFEEAKTHDEYWNAAQREMVKTGKMHNYMRMYWGKKILEWTSHPKIGYDIAVYLNDKYELDGRDMNSYAGVAWCFGKHDRPWGERSVFGMVRCMTAGGLERKFEMGEYILNFK